MKMNRYVTRGLWALCFCVGISACSDTPDTESGESTQEATNTPVNRDRANLNVSILMDLSDRISPRVHPNSTMEYYQRDLGYIGTIAEAFQTHVRSKKIFTIDDQMQVFFDPPPMNPEINNLAESLKIHYTRHNATKEKVMAITDQYRQQTEKIYDLAINDDNYVGSDIWRFFKDKVEDYCIEEGYRNVLVILTDGYIYHENTVIKEGTQSSYITPKYLASQGFNATNWEEKLANGYRLLKANSDLDDLEILVLGVNPGKANPFEGDIILKFWQQWFEAMGIEKYEIKFSDIPANQEELIRGFVMGKH